MNEFTTRFLRSWGVKEERILQYLQSLEELRKKVNHGKESISTVEKYIKTDDGNLIFMHQWKVRKNENIKRIFICQHGHNMHADLFLPLIDYFAEDTMIFAIDNRGHGRSGPVRGNFNNYKQSLAVFDELIETSKKHYPSVPIYLIGESLGSALILHYLSKNNSINKKVKGAILISPPILLSIIKFFRKLPILNKIMQISLKVLAKATQDRVIVKWPQSDENSYYLDEYNDYDRHDLLKRRFLSFRSILTLLDVLLPLHEIGKEIYTPILILQGKCDQILDYRGAKLLYNLIPINRKEIIIFGKSDHSLLMDKHAQSVYSLIDEWTSK